LQINTLFNTSIFLFLALHNVSDIFVMGGCLILETLVLLNWCEKHGYGPLGITGLSMGGHMASLAASNYPKPLVLVPCLSWSTASSVFTEGCMSHSINWDALETQYYSDGQYREKLSKMVTVVDDAFIAGKHFVKSYPKSVSELREDIKDTKEITAIPDDNSVNLAVINDTKKKFLEINGRSNKLNLSMELLDKLLKGEKCELTAAEINELNEKIKIALKNLRNSKKGDAVIIEEQAKLTVDSEEKQVAISNASAIQSDTSSLDTSTIISTAFNLSRTKLLGLLSSDEKSEHKTEPVRGKIEIGKTNWWEREATQFMRGMMVRKSKTIAVESSSLLIFSSFRRTSARI
jgi:hypothetical protein